MKIFTKFLVVLMAMLYSQLAVAKVDFMAEALEKIKVINIAPAVQEQLNKASPDERANLEAAIYKGELFIPLHFSGKAYDTTPENSEWQEETAPLVALDRNEWEHQYELLEIRLKKLQINNEIVFTARLVCPQVSLIGLQHDKSTTSLTYRSVSVGTLIYYRGYDFSSMGAKEIYDTRIDVDYRFLVSAVKPPDKWNTFSYTWLVGEMKRFVGDPRRYGGYSTKEQENEKIKIYRKTIKKIEESAAQICR